MGQYDVQYQLIGRIYMHINLLIISIILNTQTMMQKVIKSTSETIPLFTQFSAQYDGLPRDHLLSIIESLKNNQSNMFSPRTRKSGSPDSDLERNELLCDTPHQEILQLQNYFMDMLAEVDQLKITISSLQTEQDRTTNLLKQKEYVVDTPTLFISLTSIL